MSSSTAARLRAGLVCFYKKCPGFDLATVVVVVLLHPLCFSTYLGGIRGFGHVGMYLQESTVQCSYGAVLL